MFDGQGPIFHSRKVKRWREIWSEDEWEIRGDSNYATPTTGKEPMNEIPRLPPSSSTPAFLFDRRLTITFQLKLLQPDLNLELRAGN